MAASLDSLHLHVARVHDLISDTVEHAWRNALPRQRSEIMLSRTPPKPSLVRLHRGVGSTGALHKSSAGISPSSSHGSPADRLAEAIRLQADARALKLPSARPVRSRQAGLQRSPQRGRGP